MKAIVQHSVNELALEVEPFAEAAWPARETARLNGWLLRFSDGYSSRCNSVSTLSFKGSLPRAIKTVEAEYRDRRLLPQFQISPASQPAELEEILLAHGYRHKTPTVVMVAAAPTLAGSIDPGHILDAPNSDFVALTLEGSHSAADGLERLETLARVASPKAFVVVRSEGRTVACGASVVTGDWASVYVMRTAAGHRRKGHGRSVLAGIARWALSQNASRLYLQVDETNSAGRALYARTGFQDGYHCLHYFSPAP